MKQNKKPSYKIMLAVLDQCSKKNLMKAVFSIFAYSIIESVIFILTMIPFVGSMTSSGTSITAAVSVSTKIYVLTLVLFIIACVVIMMLNYGLTVVMSRMVEKNYVTIGHLFSGFKSDKRILKAGIIFTFLFALGTVITVALLLAFNIKIDATSLTDENLYSTVVVVFCIFSLTMLVLLLPFVFVWVILYTDKKIKPFAAFKKSFKLLFSHVFHFIGFVLISGGINLIITIVVTVLSSFIPSNASSAMQLLSFFLSMVVFVAQYIALVRMYMALPIYFYSIEGALHVSTTSDEENSTQKTSEIEEEKKLPPVNGNENKDSPK